MIEPKDYPDIELPESYRPDGEWISRTTYEMYSELEKENARLLSITFILGFLVIALFLIVIGLLGYYS